MVALSESALQAFRAFVMREENLGHFGRVSAYEVSGKFVAEAIEAAETFSAKAAAEAAVPAPHRVLDLGCSIGIKVIALARRFPAARVIGVDVERSALDVAEAIAKDAALANTAFVEAPGENLPFGDAAFDFVLCHTTIEHVRDVDSVIGEMARVLRPGGALHLMAPNYRFPLEPHLGVWCLPELGKGHIAWMARRQGVRDPEAFLGHLQLVTGPWLERAMTACGLHWRNLAEDKIRAVARGEDSDVIAFRGAVRAFALARRIGLAGPLAAAAARLRLYPSLAYVARKPCAA